MREELRGSGSAGCEMAAQWSCAESSYVRYVRRWARAARSCWPTRRSRPADERYPAADTVEYPIVVPGRLVNVVL